MHKIEQTYIIAAPPQDVWRALTDTKIIRKWSGAGAKFPLKTGAAYSLWDGSIGGEILAIVPERRLAQSWKPENWTITNSVVTFTLTPTQDGTRVDLRHENVEDWDLEGTTQGWDLYYLGAIKRMFEAPVAKAKTGHAQTVKAKQPAKAKKPAIKKTTTKKKLGAKKK